MAESEKVEDPKEHKIVSILITYYGEGRLPQVDMIGTADQAKAIGILSLASGIIRVKLLQAINKEAMTTAVKEFVAAAAASKSDELSMPEGATPKAADEEVEQK